MHNDTILLIQSSISNQNDEFQCLVVDVLHREIVPDIVNISRGNKSFKKLLSKSIKFLKSLKWVTVTTVSNRQKFCWGILATCCSKINVSTENADWANHFCSVFTDLNLGTIFSAYCKEKNLVNGQCIITANIPADIQYHSLEDIHK